MMPKPCHSCQGLFGMMENCQVCKGSGYEFNIAPQPVSIPPIQPIARITEKRPGRLTYDVVTRATEAIHGVCGIFYENGFSGSLANNFDDATTTDEMKVCLQNLIDGQGDQILRLSRLLKRLNDSRQAILESEI